MTKNSEIIRLAKDLEENCGVPSDRCVPIAEVLILIGYKRQERSEPSINIPINVRDYERGYREGFNKALEPKIKAEQLKIEPIRQERSGLRVEFPEFKHVCGDFNGVSYREGWNACIDEMKKLNSSSAPQGLKPLSVEKVHEELQRLDQKMERPGNYYRARHICAKFAVPNEGLNEEVNKAYQECELIIMRAIDPLKAVIKRYPERKELNERMDTACLNLGQCLSAIKEKHKSALENKR